MNFVNTPIEFEKSDASVTLKRGLEERIKMLDNLVELIVFTPKGEFSADPDFGFEYWNHEYSNIHHREFNSHHSSGNHYGLYNDVTRKECQESIKKSLETYEPQIKHIDVSIELEPIGSEKQKTKKQLLNSLLITEELLQLWFVMKLVKECKKEKKTLLKKLLNKWKENKNLVRDFFRCNKELKMLQIAIG